MTSDPIYQIARTLRANRARLADFKRDALFEHRPRPRHTSGNRRAPPHRSIDPGRSRSSRQSKLRPARLASELPRVDAREPRRPPWNVFGELTGRDTRDGKEQLESSARRASRSRRMSSRNRSPNATCVNPFAQASATAARVRRHPSDADAECARCSGKPAERLRLKYRASDTMHRHAKCVRLVHGS